MLPPIFLHEVDGDELMVFADAKSVVNFLEPDFMSASNDKYYDSEGRLLSWNCNPQSGLVFQDAEQTPTHQERLREVIIRNLVRRGSQTEEIASLAMPELVGMSLRYLG
ncbi:MAG: hypothetical protein JWM57_2135 [Phycisphaerales bacterium]|nr:hypothetical protein [Phycisphaerales bacterium]